MTNSVNESRIVESNLLMNDKDTDDDFSLLDLLHLVVDNLRLLVVVPLFVGVSALCLSFLVQPVYTAKTQFLPPQQQQSAAASMLASIGNLGGLAGAVGGIKNPADQFLAYLRSVTLQDALIDRFKLLERYSSKNKTVARLSLSGNVRAVSGKDGIISVEVDDWDPLFAAQLANAHVEELGKLLGKLATTEAQQRRLFFENQLTQAKNKLIQSEIALKATGVSGNILKSNPTTAVAAVAGIQAAITAQEIKLGSMRGYLTESAPDFRQAISELASLRAQLEKQEQDSPLTNASGISKGDYINKYRDFKYHETLLELFSKQFELAKVDEAREGAVIQVLDFAEPPELKSKPKKAQIAIIVTIVTFFILLIFLFFRKIFDNTIQKPENAEKINLIYASWQKAIGKTKLS
jgi:uncharacterized protein involved in exopolysaccharide biosynthesis